ncbi:hypothetical protein CRG98_008099, partial [Punica granatum]
MLRIAGRRLSSLTFNSSRPISAAFASSRGHDLGSDISSSRSSSSTNALLYWNPELRFPIRGFSSEAIAPSHDIGLISDLPATVAAVKNPTSKI